MIDKNEEHDQIVLEVIEKYAQRSEIGMRKYNSTLEKNNHDNYMQHLQEELMDATLYLQKLMSMEKEITNLVKKHPNDTELGMKVRALIN